MQNKLWGNRLKDWVNIQEPTGAPIYDHVLNSLPITRSTKLLDIGCGTGYFAKLASDKGAAVTGFDSAPEFIEEAKQRVPTATFVLGEMEQLPFKDNSLNIVCGFNSFQYAANTKNALTEAKRVLANDGKLVIVIWGNKEKCEIATFLKNVNDLLPAIPAKSASPFSLSENQLLEQLLTEAGLIKINTTDIIAALDYPDIETAIKGLLSLGALALSIENSGIEKVREAIINSIQPYVQTNGRVVYHNQYKIIVSEK